MPPFSYSIGIWQTQKAPEAMVIGLNNEVAHTLLNDYHAMVCQGQKIQAESVRDDFIEDYDVCFKPVAKQFYSDYLNWAMWYYKGDNFEVLQLVYSSNAGVWPWDDAATEPFKVEQPVLHA